MFISILEHIRQEREMRRSHLALLEPCIEIGGGSKEFRGLLAHFLKTTMPSGRFIQLCHACHNPKCSNPKHLYWGTAKDNCLDQKENGTFQTPKTRMIAKYGEEKYSEIVSDATRKARAASSEITSLTVEKLVRIRETILSVPLKRGRVAKLSILLNVSHTHVRRYMKRLSIK